MSGPQPRLNLTKDHLHAELILAAGCTVEVAELRQLVARAGLRHGLDPSAIAAAATSNADEERRYVLAAGTPPTDPYEAGPFFAAEHGSMVEANQVIGHIREAHLGTPGLGVDGRQVAPKDVAQSSQQVGAGIDRNQNELIAHTAGKFCLIKGIGLVVDPVIEPVKLPPLMLRVAISDNELEATLHLPPHTFVTPVELAAAVQKAGVQYGLDRSALAAATRPDAGERTLVLARGARQQSGVDERLEKIIEVPEAYSIDEEGVVDFRAAHKSLEVKAGTVLAHWHKATPGEDGITVLGRQLVSRPGKGQGVHYYKGDGVSLSLDGHSLVAARDGVVQVDHFDRHRVDNVLVIDGDIDNESGSVDTDFPVHITGDIKAGFSVRTGGFLEVDGVIEDAEIRVDGDLTVRRGILPGQREVRVGGDIAALYCNGRHVHAKNMAIIKDIRHCQVHVTERVIAQQIIGGNVHAAIAIILQIAGNEEEEPTLLEAGFDPELRTALAATKHCQRGMEEEIGRLTQEGQDASSLAGELTKRLEIQKKSGASTGYLKSLAQDAKASLVQARQCREAMQNIQESLDALLEQSQELRDQRDALRAQALIRVHHQVYPRVTFSVGGAGSDVSLQEQSGGAWRVVEGEVKREIA
jgi:uncharacterized protein (DUF342 family)